MDTAETDRPIPEPSAEVYEQFLKWRSPRFGGANPERMNNPVWEWIIRSRLNAYQTNEKFGGPESMDAGPCWCFSRFGRSETNLPDGRIIRIAGEHEDSYDADFCIYNDVVVEYPDGRLEILGYPREVFQPTDFHSATLVGDGILIVGNLGYPEDRRVGTTPIYRLDLATLCIATIEATGSAPGWIHGHRAELKNDSIVITRGELEVSGETSLVENIDDWEFNFADRVWTRLTQRRWQQWRLRRKDRQTNRLWQIRSAQFDLQFNISKDVEQLIESMPEIVREAMAERLDVEPADLSELYRPGIPHESVPSSEEEFGVSRIRIGEVVIRYVEGMYDVRIVCEGELPDPEIEKIVGDLREKLSLAERTPYEAIRLPDGTS